MIFINIYKKKLKKSSISSVSDQSATKTKLMTSSIPKNIFSFQDASAS